LGQDDFTLNPNRGELSVIVSAIGHALLWVDDWEFSALIAGASKDEVRDMVDTINAGMEQQSAPE
jgi:hypothetical protein